MRQQTFVNEKPTLFITATPIGNLEDFSLRAINVLKSVAFIACEDTRQTAKLTSHYNISTPLFSCHQHNEKQATIKILNKLKEGFDIALVSDAGYPLISDPGSFLTSEVLKNNFNVSVIPGASAFLSALVASGLSCDKFYFFGFLNNKHSIRKKELTLLNEKKETIIFYESPYRVIESLKDMLEIFGDRNICLAREITKKFEEYIRGTISEVLNQIQEGLKGEIVLIIEGYQKEIIVYDNNLILSEIENAINLGLSNKDAVSKIAKKYSLKKNEVYNLFHSN